MTSTLIKKVSRKGFVLILTLSTLSILIESNGLPMSILFGGLLGLFNFRGLARSVQSFTYTEGVKRPARRIAALTMLRFSLFAIVLALLYKQDLINIPGFVIGFTLVVCLILFEGYLLMRKVE